MVAISARGDWGLKDLAWMRDTRSWVTFNRVEAIEAAGHAGMDTPTSDVLEAARYLKAALGTSRLVASLGAEIQDWLCAQASAKT